MTTHPLMQQSVWFDQSRVQDAECHYQEKLAAQHAGLVVQGVGLSVGVSVDANVALKRLDAVEKENTLLRKATEDLKATVSQLVQRITALERSSSIPNATVTSEPVKKPAIVEDDDDDDDFDLDASDDEDPEELERMKQERIAAYAAKKSLKPKVVAKSNLILDIKPWDDETDLKEMENCVRTITADGLLWGTSKLVPVAYGIKKLQISCVIEDDKIGTDFLEEQITAFDDVVQSMDVVAFNKI